MLRAAPQEGRARQVTPGNAFPGDFCGYFLPEPRRDLGTKGLPRAKHGGWGVGGQGGGGGLPDSLALPAVSWKMAELPPM